MHCYLAQWGFYCLHYNHHYSPFLRDPLWEMGSFIGGERWKSANPSGCGRAGWSRKAPHLSCSSVLVKHLCPARAAAPGQQPTNTSCPHSWSRDTHTGDKRLTTQWEPQLDTTDSTCSLLVPRTTCQELWASLHHFPFFLSFYFLIAYTKCINANGKTFHPMSKLCSLELTYATSFSCHFFPTDQGRFRFVWHFFLVQPPEDILVCCWPHFSLPFQTRAALVSKAILASLTFRGVPASEMNGLTRKCADNKERNGYIWQNTHTRPKQYKSKGIKKKSKSKPLWMLWVELMSVSQSELDCSWKKAYRKWKNALKWKGGSFLCPAPKNKVCVWGRGGERRKEEKKKEMGKNKPQKMEFSLEKLERNSSTPCALYMLTEGLL